MHVVVEDGKRPNQTILLLEVTLQIVVLLSPGVSKVEQGDLLLIGESLTATNVLAGWVDHTSKLLHHSHTLFSLIYYY